MSRKLIGALAAAWVLAAAGTAQAGPITFNYVGTVSDIFDSTGSLPMDVVLGAEMSLSFTFESTTPDSNPANPNHGFYAVADGVFLDYTVSVGGITFTLDPAASAGGIQVQDGFGIAPDIYQAEAFLNGPSGYSGIRAGLVFYDTTQTALAADVLPLTQPDPADFDQFAFLEVIGFVPDGAFFRITAKDLRAPQIATVPEPSSLALFGAGLAGLVMLSRQRRRKIGDATRGGMALGWSARRGGGVQ